MAKKKSKNKRTSFSGKRLWRTKRGDFLGESVAGIVTSVACIVVLIIIAVVVYNLFSEKSDLDKAESNMKLISGEMEIIQAGNSSTVGNLIIYPPQNWVLRSYSDTFPKTECYGKKSCLCICQAVSCEGVQKICYGYNYDLEITNSYTISKSWYNPGKYLFNPEEYPHAIGFTKAAEGLKIYKQENKIIIEQVVTNK